MKKATAAGDKKKEAKNFLALGRFLYTIGPLCVFATLTATDRW
jgi:hypothetical protein